MIKKILISIFFISALLYSALYFFLLNPVLTKKAPLFTRASWELLKRDVVEISGIQPARMFLNIHSLNKTASLIEDRFIMLGYNTKIQKFRVKDNIAERYQKYPFYKKYSQQKELIKTTEYKNVIARIGPEDSPIIIIGAHYDVCMNLPGADDNASGVAALLELARLLKLNESKLTQQVELVAYSLEEPPYFRSENMGSYHHAQSMKNKNIELMISLETIGYFTDQENSQDYPAGILKHFFGSQGNFITLIGNVSGWFKVRQMKAYFKANSELKIYSLAAPARIPGIDFSDHLNYGPLGIPAFMVTDTAFYRNKEYHESGDTADRLDYVKIAQVVDGLLSIVLTVKSP
ncbi:MAG: M28 family peptidase [Bdellovibrionaceae bacterium]|jgi:Zn-dependent M28 family amino/carboxypeptidase|nr:M28 family peptidase [Pseudobdellovibrionaceae bacterium]